MTHSDYSSRKYKRTVFFDPDWVSIDETIIFEALGKLRNVDCIFYFSQFHADILKKNNPDVSTYDLKNSFGKDHSYSDLSDLTWSIAHDFQYDPNIDSKVDLVLYLEEYNIGSHTSKVIRASILLQILNSIVTDELVFVSDDRRLIKLVQSIIPTAIINYIHPTTHQERKNTRKYYYPMLLPGICLKSTIKGLLGSISKKTKILYQDHRNTSPIIEHLQMRGAYQFYRLGAVSNNRSIGINVEFDISVLVTRFLGYIPGKKIRKLAKGIQGKYHETLLKRVRGFLEVDPAIVEIVCKYYPLITESSLSKRLSRINAMRRIFNQIRPDLVLLNNYNSFDQKLFALFARKHSIKSVSVEHGLFNSIRFRNDIIHTDFYLAWGNLTKDKYHLKSNREKIVVVGNPLFNTLSSKGENVSEKPRVLLSTPVAPFLYRNPLTHLWSPAQGNALFYSEFRFFMMILEFLVRNEFTTHIQVHPGHDLEWWKSIIGSREVNLSQRDVLVNLPKHDLMVVSNSTLILEALAYGLHVIIYQPFDIEVINDLYNDFDGHGYVDYCSNMREFESIILNKTTGEEELQRIKKRDEYVSAAVACSGHDAFNNINAFLESIL